MVLELLDAGEKIVVLDNLSTGRRSAVPPGVELIVGEFGDEALVKDLLVSRNVDAIIHFAAKIVVPELGRRPARLLLNNTASARSLLASAVAQKVKNLIFPPPPPSMASRSIIRFPRTKPETRLALWPSKLMVEWMLEDTAKAHDLHYVVLRYFNVAGADRRETGQSSPTPPI